MKKIRLFLTGLLLVVTAAAYAQDITVSGTVTDAATGEVIVGASVPYLRTEYWKSHSWATRLRKCL